MQVGEIGQFSSYTFFFQVLETLNVFPTSSEDFLHCLSPWFFLKNLVTKQKMKKYSHSLLASPSWPPLCCFQQDASNLLCPRGGLAGAFLSCISLLGLFLSAQGGNRHQHFQWIKMLLPGHCLGSN